ncbi:MAG: hypothetical protein U0570_11740 [Phycisphaerales bacterium]
MSGSEQALKLILEGGDPLEQYIFANTAFANAFSVYPDVWGRFVLPNRADSDGVFANEAWAAFVNTIIQRLCVAGQQWKPTTPSSI